jgi:hypothetical protein
VKKLSQTWSNIFLTFNRSVLKVIYTSIQQNDIDDIARSIYEISKEYNKIDKLVEIVMKLEFTNLKASKQTALRTNSLTTKIIDYLMKDFASKYSADLLREPIIEILSQKNDFEIDPQFLFYFLTKK